MMMSIATANAQQADLSASPVSTKDLSQVIEYATPPEQVADSVVILVPDTEMSLNSPKGYERTIAGNIREVVKGVHPKVIIHPANSMILPIKAGVPMKVYLKRFADRDAYYPIAIFSVAAE
jgi:hypothetical protein